MVARPDGSGQRRVPHLNDGGGSPRVIDTESVSAGGNRVALKVATGDAPAGDIARSLYTVDEPVVVHIAGQHSRTTSHHRSRLPTTDRGTICLKDSTSRP